MKTIRLLSWNVNGIRAADKKGALDWLANDGPDILCLQETKATEDQIPPAVQELEGYRGYYLSAEKKGYSGVGILTDPDPVTVESGIGNEEFDREGRVLIAHYESFTLLNVYFPNGKASKERLAYKMGFYDAFLDYIEKLRLLVPNLVICGDVNTAHREIDLARPKENEKTSGFLPEERAWIDRLLEHGYLDTLRLFTHEPAQYSWWDYKTRARERNVGWRIDYFFVTESLKSRVTSGFIMPEILGSDHCPVGIELEI